MKLYNCKAHQDYHSMSMQDAIAHYLAVHFDSDGDDRADIVIQVFMSRSSVVDARNQIMKDFEEVEVDGEG